MRKSLILLLGILLLIFPLLFLGCEGDDGAQGPAGAVGPTGSTGDPGQDLTKVTEPESCAGCHSGAGTAHQAGYNELYQDEVITIENIAYTNDGTNDVVTFKMMKGSVPFDCREADSLGIYFVQYDNVARKFQFTPTSARLSIKGTLSYNFGPAQCTSTKAESTFGDLSALNGLFVIYGRDETLGTIPGSRVAQNKYPFAGVLPTAAFTGDPYISLANARAVEPATEDDPEPPLDGCERCHTVPYLKHGYIYGRVDHVEETDFYTCKACHLDDGDGGHFIWQLLVDD
ncbi:MAG TPA: hypothetical protein VFU42_00050, partial [Candidatus Deferrimicrobiaceae bacterium]|nr:hypothetical protein [Candidatus Deferrimicrobiaceae bacterium]